MAGSCQNNQRGRPELAEVKGCFGTHKAAMSPVLSMLEKHFGKTALITSNKKNLSVCHQ